MLIFKIVRKVTNLLFNVATKFFNNFDKCKKNPIISAIMHNFSETLTPLSIYICASDTYLFIKYVANGKNCRDEN